MMASRLTPSRRRHCHRGTQQQSCEARARGRGARMPYRSVTVRGVALLCFPPGDAVFSSMAGRMLTSAPKKDPLELERALRPIYTRTVVRARDSLASMAGAAWYVYRDGRYSPFVDAERWWEDADV